MCVCVCVIWFNIVVTFGQNLDLDVKEFQSMPSTVENLAYIIWQRLLPRLGPLLHKVSVFETEKNWASYKS